MDLRDLKEKLTKNLKEKLEIELEIQKHERAERERLEGIRRAEARKIQAQKDHEAYLYERDKEQQLKNEADTPRGRRLKTEEEARTNRQRAIDMGYTAKQIERKFKNTTELIRDMNKESESQLDDLLDNVNLSKFKTNLRKLT